MIELYHTGGGCMAYLVTNTNTDTPGLFGYVTDDDGSRVPENLESDPMMIGIYRAYDDSGDEDLSLITLDGRAGLIAWLVQNMSLASEYGDTEGPIMELVDHVVMQMILCQAKKLKLTQ